MYRISVRLMGACHIVLGAACLGAFHSTKQNSYLSAYLGYYDNIVDVIVRNRLATVDQENFTSHLYSEIKHVKISHVCYIYVPTM